MGAPGQVIHVHPAAPPKPPEGAACNGCGVCCLAEPCPLGMLLSGRRSGACRALRWDDGAARYLCGAMTQPDQVLGTRWRWLAPALRRLAGRWIAAGAGCDASMAVSAAPSARDGAPD